MGMSQLPEIAALIGKERSPDEPMAIIQNATTVHQKSITASASTIVAEAALQDIGTPAVIVIGKVVAERLTDVTQFVSVHAVRP